MNFLLALLKNKFIILTVVAFLSGWIVNGWRHDAKIKKAVVKALKQAEKQHVKDLKLARKEADIKTKIKKEINETIEKVDHANINDTVLPPDFIKLYNESL